MRQDARPAREGEVREGKLEAMTCNQAWPMHFVNDPLVTEASCGKRAHHRPRVTLLAGRRSALQLPQRECRCRTRTGLSRTWLSANDPGRSKSFLITFLALDLWAYQTEILFDLSGSSNDRKSSSPCSTTKFRRSARTYTGSRRVTTPGRRWKHSRRNDNPA